MARISVGGTVHTVPVGQPKSVALDGVACKSTPTIALRQSGSPAIVTTYKEYEGSPEQLKVLNSSVAREDVTSVDANSARPGTGCHIMAGYSKILSLSL